MNSFENDIEKSLAALFDGGLILYPTDTIWGIGCDATNENAVEQIYILKKRDDHKSMIILAADENELEKYADVPSTLLEFLQTTDRPTTVIYQGARNIASNLTGADGSVAIRVVKDDFCNQLISRFGKPIVSTSANISGQPFPQVFNEISPKIKNGVDYIVQHRRDDITPSRPSAIVKSDKDGKIVIIRS